MAESAAFTGSSQLAEVMKAITDQFSNQSTTISVVIALIVVLTTLVIILLGRRRNSRRSVLIMGLCDSGKTLMYCQLVHKQQKHTVMSLKENTGILQITKKPTLTIVDLPGHERVRARLFEQYRSSARCIVFVIDSATVQRDIKDVAEFLYTILVDSVIVANKPRLLIACNKQDLTFAKGKEVIQTLLEKELNHTRRTKSAALGSTSADGDSGAGGSNTAQLGKKGEDFKFSQLHRRMKLEFVECRATAASDSCMNLEHVSDYLATKVA